MRLRVAGLFWPTLVVLATLGARTAAAQFAPWNWGASTPGSSDAWSPEAFADFLGSGHPPHPAVVRVVAPENGGTSMGSGVLVDVNPTQGLVLTNWHVIRGAKGGVLVQFPDGFQSAGRVIRHDEPWDLAAVAIWRPRAVPVPISAAPPVIGEPLSIAGYGKGPFRSEAGRCTQYLAPGAGYPLEFVELEATARQGDSGGPILNARGELAGILFGRAEGRTIGACSTRVRTFLASIGSRGMTAAEVAALAGAAAGPATVGGAPVGPLPAMAAAMPPATAPLAPPPVAAVGPTHGTISPPPSEPAPVAGDPLASIARGPAVGANAPASDVGGTPSAVPQPVPPAISAAPAPTPLEPPPPAWGDLPEGRPVGRTLDELLDVRTNGRAMMVAAGGALLALVGLRTVFGGRAPEPRRRRPRMAYDDD